VADDLAIAKLLTVGIAAALTCASISMRTENDRYHELPRTDAVRLRSDRVTGRSMHMETTKLED
jgi:hypothetical protein